MTYALVFLSGIMAIVVWWLVRQTINVQPWTEQRAVAAVPGDRGFSLPTRKVGLGVFLAVVTSLFALFISAYYMRMMGDDWVRLPLPRVLWLNTAVLIVASIAMERTRVAARWGELDRVKLGLLVGGVLSFSFLAGQLWAWRQMDAAGYFLTANPAYAFFYMLTAVHGLHLLGGLCAWGRTTVRVLRGAELSQVRLSVDLCTVYWHYLLLVWLVLFAVLSHTHP